MLESHFTMVAAQIAFLKEDEKLREHSGFNTWKGLRSETDDAGDYLACLAGSANNLKRAGNAGAGTGHDATMETGSGQGSLPSLHGQGG